MQFPFQLLQATTEQPSMLPGWLLFAGLILIFYLFMIRPQQKRQKEEASFREGLQKGDKVLTIGGIFGKIVSIDDTSIIMQVDDNTKLRVDKASLRAAPDPKEVASTKK